MLFYRKRRRSTQLSISRRRLLHFHDEPVKLLSILAVPTALRPVEAMKDKKFPLFFYNASYAIF